MEKNSIAVMAVDNLPCELPRDSSKDFGRVLLEKVLPSLVENDVDEILDRGTICKNGKLMHRFNYLHEYAFGKVSQ